MTEAIEIKLIDIQLLTDFSPRDGIDWNVVEEYYQNIADLPPILVARRKNSFKPFVLIDGWHRYHAHCKTRRDTIWAIVDEELKQKDYYFRSICANKAHGIRFTAAEKKRISRYLFIQENRTAKEISQAIGCSVRHATDLIKSLAQDKKEAAIKLAKRMSKQGVSERDIADDLKRRGFKASKSGVNRWLQPEPMLTKKQAIDIIESQTGESPKRDTEEDTTIEEARAIAMKLAGPPDEPSSTLTPMQPIKEISRTRVGVCPSCEIRTVRVPNLEFGVSAACTKIFFYCDRCDKYIEIRLLMPKKE